MSVEAMSWAFSMPIPPAPKIVLLALANNADKAGKNCFPSLKLIVDNCVPMRLRTVQYHLKWLAEEAKLITITPWFQASGRQTSNLYELCLTTTYCGEGARSCRGGRVQEVAGGRVQEVAGGRVQEVAPLLNPDPNLDLRKLEEDPLKPPAGGHVPAVVVRYEEDFESFWSIFPNKIGKKAAYRAWKKARDKPSIEQIVKAVQEALRSKKWREGFIPNPATWLNQGRWDDQPEGITSTLSVAKACVSVAPRHAQGEVCPPEVAAQLSRLFGKQFSFTADGQRGAA